MAQKKLLTAPGLHDSQSGGEPRVRFYEEDEAELDMVKDVEYDQRLSRRVAAIQSMKKIQPSVIFRLPSEDLVMKSRQILYDRIKLYGLQEKTVKGDGNCQFRSISDQLYRTPAHHRSVRERVVKQLREEPEHYIEYVPQPYEDYLKEMEKDGTWGDHVSLQSAADVYGVHICVLSSYDNHEASIIEVDPKERYSDRVLYLSFWAEIHYNSLYPDEEPIPHASSGKILGSKLLYRLISWGLGDSD